MKFDAPVEGILLEVLCQKLQPMSRTRVRKLVKNGSVSVDGEVVLRGDLKVRPGQTIDTEQNLRAKRDGSPFPVLYEDRDVIVVNKPAGLLSIATRTERSKTLYKSLNHFVQDQSKGRERVFIVHRLDREVSGIMIFAKTPEVQETLQRAWAGTEKRYVAMVEGRPPLEEGTIENWLRETRAHKVFSCPRSPEAKLAITHYRELKVFPRHTLLEVLLETGRKHQIRVHLAEMGCPIVGDRRYGARRSPIHRFGLCAYSLSFDHPFSGDRISLEIPIPKVMRSFRGRN